MSWQHRPNYRGRGFGGKPFKPVPDRWEDYTNAGNRISGTRFVCMKVPLKEELCRLVDEKQQFTPTQMISVLKERGMNLGLLIDLTNTKRYYNPQEITSSGVAYEKINVEGHEVPSSKVLERFFTVVDQFEKEQKEPAGSEQSDSVVIGVHCTHGINRTGYLVCRYLIDRLGWSVEKAIEEFNQARGHPIERENYLKALQTPPSSPAESQIQDHQMPSSVVPSADRGSYRRDFRSPRSSYEHHTRRYQFDGFQNETEWGPTTNSYRRDWGRQYNDEYQHYGGYNNYRRHDSRHDSSRYSPYDRYHQQRRWGYEQERDGERDRGSYRWPNDSYRNNSYEGKSGHDHGGNGFRHEKRYYQYVP